jgi:hypothetical protein
VYAGPVGSKHESESLFQNLAIYIIEVQTMGGIVLLGGDFNARITTLPDTINTSNLCELLQAHELAETQHPSVVAKRHNRDTNISGSGCKFLDLCYDIGLFILNGRTLGDESGEFTCLANGGHNTVDYIVSSPTIWQIATHLEVIINDTSYCAIGGDSNHMLLRIRLTIDCSFFEPQHTVVTNFFLPTFKYDKSKAEEYKLALTASCEDFLHTFHINICTHKTLWEWNYYVVVV